MGQTSSKELNHDIDHRGMSQYYSQLSTLYFSDKPQQIDLKNVLALDVALQLNDKVPCGTKETQK